MAHNCKILPTIFCLALWATFSSPTQSIASGLTGAGFPFSLLAPVESVASTPTPTDGGASLFYANFALFVAAPAATAAEDESTTASDRMQREFERAVARVQPLLERYGYGAAFAAVMAEGIGIPTPGQTLLVAGALDAAEGRMSIVLLLVLVATAATLGNSLGYALGRWGGRVALDKLKVNSQRQQHLADLFKRRGGVVVLLARFLDGLRQLNGIVAGGLQMPWWTFTAYNVAGAILWTCVWGLGTYYLGRDIHFLAGFFHRHRLLLLVLGAAAFMALVVYLARFRGKSVE